MSTLTSSDFGELKRPSTRVHAPPGGGSSWSIGGEEAVAPPPAPVYSSPQQTPRKAAPTTPVQNVFSSSSSTRSTSSSSKKINVAVIASKQQAEIVNEISQNCQTVLDANSQMYNYTKFSVPAVEDLAFAASKLIKDFDGVICIGFFNSDSALFPALSSNLLQHFMALSIGNQKPIVNGIYTGTLASPLSQIKSQQFGKSFPVDIKDLVTLGSSLQSTSSGSSSGGGSKVCSTGNVLPKNVEQAPRGIKVFLTQLRESLYEHGARGIVGLARKFRIMDDDGNRSLCLSEFKKAIAEHALNLSDKEIVELFEFFDEDNSKSISYDEFLVAIRGELNERRTQLVLQAFDVIDSDHSGIIELNDIINRYNADQHPDVISGRKSKNEIFREFLDTFDGGEKDGKVFPDEFIRYYSNVSASIDDDDYFELMIRNAWHISGGEGWCANTTCRRVLVTHEDGSQSVEEIKDDINIAKDDKKQMMNNLSQQGISNIKGIDTTGSCDNETPSKANTNLAAAYKQRQRGAGASSIIFG